MLARCRRKSFKTHIQNTLANSPPPLLKLSENWLLAACSTILNRMQEKLLKLNRTHMVIIDIKCEKSQ